VLATSRRTRVRIGVAGMFAGLVFMTTQSISDRVERELAVRRAAIQRQEDARRQAEEREKDRQRQAAMQRQQEAERQREARDRQQQEQERRRAAIGVLSNGEILGGFSGNYRVIKDGNRIRIVENEKYIYFEGTQNGNEISGYRYYNSCGGIKVQSVARPMEGRVVFQNQDVGFDCRLAPRNTQYILNRRS